MVIKSEMSENSSDTRTNMAKERRLYLLQIVSDQPAGENSFVLVVDNGKEIAAVKSQRYYFFKDQFYRDQ